MPLQIPLFSLPSDFSLLCLNEKGVVKSGLINVLSIRKRHTLLAFGKGKVSRVGLTFIGKDVCKVI